MTPVPPAPPCACEPCVLAGHGKPAVRFEAVLGRAAYELHGVEAARWYEAQAKGLAWVRDEMAKRAAARKDGAA